MSPRTLQSTALARVTYDLMQGIALYLLQEAFEAKTWPATDGLIFAPFLVVAIFVPTVVVAGLGNMRPHTLAGWTAVATVVCAGLAIYNIFRDPTGGSAIQRVAPTPVLWLCLARRPFHHSFSDRIKRRGSETHRELLSIFRRVLEARRSTRARRMLRCDLLGDVVAGRGALPADQDRIPGRSHQATLVLDPDDHSGLHLCASHYRHARRPCSRNTHAHVELVVL